MACLEPEIMIIDGLDQNGANPAAIGSQSVRKYLVTCQCTVRCRQAVSLQTLPDTFLERLFRMGDAVDAVLGAKNLYPIIVGIGHHADADVGSFHHFQPAPHFLRRYIRSIRHNGIVKVQHQQPDALPGQIFRCQPCQISGDDLWEQG